MIEIPVDFPPGWPRIASSRLFDLQSRSPRGDDGVVTAFRDGEVTLRSKRRSEGFTNAVLEIGYQGVRAGDLVVHSMDGFAGAIGVSDSDGKMSPVVQCYSPVFEVSPRYYAYVLRELARAGFITSLAKGIRERSTAFDAATFRSIRLPKPPLAVQNQIADFLDAETARIDHLQDSRRKQLELLEERELALVDSAFAFPDAHWSRLGRFVTVQTGLTVDAARVASDDDVELPYLRVANVQLGRLDLTTVTTIRVQRQLARRSSLRNGDVLMTEGGDIDKLGRGTVWRNELPTCLHQNHIFAVRPGNAIDSDFLALFTRTSAARAHFESTGVQSTNLASTSSSKVRDLNVPVVPKTVQVVIVEDLARSLARLGDLRRSLFDAAALATERKQALVTASVTGQLDLARDIVEEAS